MSNITQTLPEVSIASSRQVQETIQVKRGASAYAVTAAFIDRNIDKIDEVGELLGTVLAQGAVKGMYDKQYFKPDQKWKSFWTRNIYLREDKRQALENERMLIGTGVQLLTESAVKMGARALGEWSAKKDTFITCEQVYAVLNSYIAYAEKGANIQRANTELSKIRNSFPLDIKQKKKLYEKYNGIAAPLELLDVSSLATSENKELRNALAYFLVVINRQLYEDQQPGKLLLPDYYSLIDLNGKYGNEFMLDNQDNYDSIAMDHQMYLSLARGMITSFSAGLPNIDTNKIVDRASAMAKFDPYAIRRKKIKDTGKGGAIAAAGIFLQEPELFKNGVMTALAQFMPDEELLTTARDKCKSWGLEDKDIENVFSQMLKLEAKSAQSDVPMLMDL